MKVNWNEIHKQAVDRRTKAMNEIAFMMGGRITIETMGSFAFIYPEEVRKYFKTVRLVRYVEKRMKRSLQ